MQSFQQSSAPYNTFAYPLVLLRTAGNIDDVGDPASDLIDLMIDFKFNDHLEKADMVTWQFSDPDGVLIDDERFEPDTVWLFRFGYPGDISGIIRHRVKSFEPTFQEDGTIIISVTTLGRATETMRVRGAKNWGKTKSSDIASQIARKYGLKTKIETSPELDKECGAIIQRAEQSDFEFLSGLAANLDYEFFIEGETLYFRSRDTVYSEPIRLTVYWFDNSSNQSNTLMKSFKPGIHAHKPGKVKATSVNTKSGKAKSHKATNKTGTKSVGNRQLGSTKPMQINFADPDDEPSSEFESRHVVNEATGERELFTETSSAGMRMTNSEKDESAGYVIRMADTIEVDAQRIVDSHKKRFLDGLVNANSEFIGTPRMRAKVTIQVLGVGQRLSGLWYNTEVTHHIGAHGYSTQCAHKRGAYNGKKKSKGKNKNVKAVVTGGNVAIKHMTLSERYGDYTASTILSNLQGALPEDPLLPIRETSHNKSESGFNVPNTNGE